MITPKKKICIDCGTEQFIWSNKRCKRCDAIFRANRDINSKVSETTRKPLSKQSEGIRPLSIKRAKMEREYNIIKGKMKSEARRNPDARCFFCNGKFKSSNPIDCHHLAGRVENKLTDVKGLVLVHRNCHAQYHNNPIERIKWYEEWMERIVLSHPTLYDKESNKYDK